MHTRGVTWEQAKARVAAWWARESGSARRDRERRELVARIDALPLALADAAVAKLTGKEPISELDPASYTEAFVWRYDEWTFGDLRIYGVEPMPTGRVVGDLDHSVFVRTGELEARVVDGVSAPSIAHLALRELGISQRDVEAIEADVSTWVRDAREEPVDPEPPPPTPGPEAFELDQRPRAWALVGSVVTLAASTSVVCAGVAMLLARAGCGGLVLLLLGSSVAFAMAVRLREVLFLEPATRRLRPDAAGIFDPVTDKRVEWADVRSVEPHWLTIDCRLEGGRTLRLAKSAFLQPHVVGLAIQRAARNGASRYR